LVSGLYTVTVTDNGPTGCTQTQSIVLSDNVPQATVSFNSPVTTTCVGSNDGMAEFTLDTEPGFALPAEVVITDLAENVVMNGNLAPGDYCISVLDANGCVAGGNCFTVLEISQIDLDIAILPEGCIQDGSITLTDLQGGNGGYTFDWSDLAGNDNPQNRTGLMAGTYSVTVTDVEGCSVSVNGLNVVRDCSCQSPVLESVVILEATCGNADGRASINLAGGPSGFTFTWPDNISFSSFADMLLSGTYSVTITDNSDPTCMLVETFTVGNSDGPQIEISTLPAGCNIANGTATLTPSDFSYIWNDGNMESTRSDLNAGLHQVTIVDPSNPDCFDVQTIVIEETNNLMTSVIVENNPEPGMSDGSATIIVTGGSGNYSYSWGPTATRNDLSSGLYSVFITDLDSGCETRIVFVINDDSSSATISLNGINPVLCAGGNQGQVDFDLNLASDFNGPERIEIVDGDGNTFENGALSAGDYCALVFDINNVLTTSTCFTIEPVQQIDLDLAIVDMSCLNPGGIEVVSTTGGTGEYNYQWSPNADPITDPLNLTNLEADTYGLTLTDSNGCSVSEIFDVSDDSYPLQVTLEGVDVGCDGIDDGMVISNVVGGQGMLNYSWSNNDETANLSDLPAGNYTVTVTDENGCTGISTASLEAPTPVVFDLPSDTMVCTTPIVLAANANMEGLIYSWTDANGNVIGSNDQIVLNLSGDITEVLLTVVDSFGCTTMQMVSLVNSTPDVELDNMMTACLGEPEALRLILQNLEIQSLRERLPINLAVLLPFLLPLQYLTCQLTF